MRSSLQKIEGGDSIKSTGTASFTGLVFPNVIDKLLLVGTVIHLEGIALQMRIS
ncbi:MAG: hypothetical protein U0T81_10420 [Saprospiraceae bacterium]